MRRGCRTRRKPVSVWLPLLNEDVPKDAVPAPPERKLRQNHGAFLERHHAGGRCRPWRDRRHCCRKRDRLSRGQMG